MSFTLTLTALRWRRHRFRHPARDMRLSSSSPCDVCSAYVNLNALDPLVLVIFWFFFLVPYIGAWVIGAKEPIKVGAFWSAAITSPCSRRRTMRDHARGYPVDPARQVWSATRSAGLLADHGEDRPAAGVPQHAAVLLTQTIILFPGHLARVRDLGTDFLGAAAKVANATTAGRDVQFRAVVYFVVSYGCPSW